MKMADQRHWHTVKGAALASFDLAVVLIDHFRLIHSVHSFWGHLVHLFQNLYVTRKRLTVERHQLKM